MADTKDDISRIWYNLRKRTGINSLDYIAVRYILLRSASQCHNNLLHLRGGDLPRIANMRQQNPQISNK